MDECHNLVRPTHKYEDPPHRHCVPELKLPAEESMSWQWGGAVGKPSLARRSSSGAFVITWWRGRTFSLWNLGRCVK